MSDLQKPNDEGENSPDNAPESTAGAAPTNKAFVAGMQPGQSFAVTTCRYELLLEGCDLPIQQHVRLIDQADHRIRANGRIVMVQPLRIRRVAACVLVGLVVGLGPIGPISPISPIGRAKRTPGVTHRHRFG